MDLKKAYSILGVDSKTPKDEVKKKYRELTKKFHPDVNKSPDAEDKFKQINAAYDKVINHKPSKKNIGYTNPFVEIHEQVELSPIEIDISISFKESVLGCKKDVSYDRQIKCASCNGRGAVVRNNGCDKCGGKGVIISQQGYSIMHMTCDKCHGIVNYEACVICNEEGATNTTTKLTVTIPAGVPNGGILRIPSKGNFSVQFMMMENYTDLFIKINVEQEEGLSLIDKDVVSHVNISLLEALTGCSKTIKTINGNKDIKINAKSLNKDEVIIPKLGVAGIGNHRVVINISYPDNVDKLIELLKE